MRIEYFALIPLVTSIGEERSLSWLSLLLSLESQKMQNCKRNIHSKKHLTGYFFSSKLYTRNGRRAQRITINVFGLLVVAFGLIILYLVSDPDYERPVEHNPEELPLVTSTSSSSSTSSEDNLKNALVR